MASLSHILPTRIFVVWSHARGVPGTIKLALAMPSGITGFMSAQTLQNLVLDAGSWPLEDQEELASYARVIEARRTGLYRVTDAERSALLEGIQQADRGEFVSEAEVSAARNRHTA